MDQMRRGWTGSWASVLVLRPLKGLCSTLGSEEHSLKNSVLGHFILLLAVRLICYLGFLVVCLTMFSLYSDALLFFVKTVFDSVKPELPVCDNVANTGHGQPEGKDTGHILVQGTPTVAESPWRQAEP